MAPFTYQPFRSSFSGTIGELLAHKNDPQAQAALQSGQAWAGAIQNIGQIAGNLPTQIEQAKRVQQDDQMRAMQMQDLQRKVDDMKALDQAFQTPGGRDSILNALPGHLRPTVMKQFTDADEAAAKANKAISDAATASNDYFGSLAAGVKAHQYDPTAAQLALAHAKSTFQNNPVMLDQITRIEAAIHQNPTPETVQQLVDPLIAQSTKQRELSASEANAAARVTQAQTGAQRAQLEAPKIQAETKKTEAELAGTLPMTPAQKASNDIAQQNLQLGRSRLTLEQQKLAQQQSDVTDLTPAGLDAAAMNYAKTGQLPPLGMGDKQTRKQIINRAAELMPGLDLASNRADFTANQQSLANLQKQRDAIGSFEQTASKNIDIFLNTAGKVVDSGSPLANSLLRQVSGKMLGSPDQAAYEAARQVAINEIAKITSNPTMAGQLSDTARKEVENFNPANATLKQSVAVFRVLKQDMANRATALDDAIAGIKSRITSKSSSNGPAEGTEGVVNGVPAVWKTVNGTTGWYAK